MPFGEIIREKSRRQLPGFQFEKHGGGTPFTRTKQAFIQMVKRKRRAARSRTRKRRRVTPRARRRVRKSTHIEWKHLDTAISSTEFANDQTLIILNAPAVGDGVDNRDGRWITMKSVHFKYQVDAQATQANPSMPCVAQVIWEPFPNQAAVPTMADIWETDGSLDSHRNIEHNAGRFKILSSRNFRVTKPATAEDDPTKQHFTGSWFIPLRGKKTRFDSAGVAATDFTRGRLLLALRSSTAAAAVCPVFTANMRLTFTA